MPYDVLVIGAGLSGLTAAALLAKRGLRVAVFEKAYLPGGSCGVFRRNGVTFDQGSSMLFGFGEKGFNAHRFVFNCLEEPIGVIRHDLLYCVHYEGRRIRFWPDVDRFVDELSDAFPSERDGIRRFYRDMERMYRHIMVENPVYASADETDRRAAGRQMLRHPISYARFLSYLNLSAGRLLRRYFRDPALLRFFDKLTSTYCYSTTDESPAVLAAVMFIDNHVGGSWYPAGSTLFLPGLLEKSIEKNGGRLFYGSEVVRIRFRDGRPAGVELADGTVHEGGAVIYSGTVWNLYGRLIPPEETTPRRAAWAKRFVPTYPSVVLYAYVDASVVPADTLPVEMLVGNPERIDESEVTVYLPGIDDQTVNAGDGGQVVIAIGPSFVPWDSGDRADYLWKKEQETTRLLGVLERRFPGIGAAVRFTELATPATIERYTMKNGGAVAGPKQMLGQHMFRRLHIRSEWDNLFCCGESTTMGTGTPTVTVSGVSAANAVLRGRGLPIFEHREGMKQYVRTMDKPFTADRLFEEDPEPLRTIRRQAMRCALCERPGCMTETTLDIRGILRRTAVGNVVGARRLLREHPSALDPSGQDVLAATAETRCIRGIETGEPVAIRSVFGYLAASE